MKRLMLLALLFLLATSLTITSPRMLTLADANRPAITNFATIAIENLTLKV